MKLNLIGLITLDDLIQSFFKDMNGEGNISNGLIDIVDG